MVRHLSDFGLESGVHSAVTSSSLSWRQSRWYHHLQVLSQCMPQSDISLQHLLQGLDIDWVSKSLLFIFSVFSGCLAWRDEATDCVTGCFAGVYSRNDGYLVIRALCSSYCFVMSQ